MAVGIWTLVQKSDYISLLPSSMYAATAYILVIAGAVVMVTGFLGCCATFKERKSLLKVVSVHTCVHYRVLLLFCDKNQQYFEEWKKRNWSNRSEITGLKYSANLIPFPCSE